MRLTLETRERWSRLLLAASLLFGTVALLVPAFPDGASAADEAAPTAGNAVRKTVTATRAFIDADGSEHRVDERRVSLEVSQTTDLRGRQEVHVSWSGAVPTGGVVADPNSSDGRNQEYPFVLLQCRGVDTTGTVPTGQSRLSPETCWTQTSTERYLASAVHTPAWRFDAYADAADRGPVVGAPEPLPAECAQVSEPLTARWVPFRAQGGRVYYGGPDPSVGCTSLAPESDSAEAAGGLPANTTYGITRPDGTGAADFAVWTDAENASLGCSATVECALVAVPVVGLSCDAYGRRLPAGTQQTTKSDVPLTDAQLASADATCRRTGAYQPGEPRSSTTTDQAVRGALWWSPSNWRNRITVPLEFATTGAVCDGVTSEAPQEVLGSVVLNELTASWRPTFCTTDGLFPFTHVQQADSLARTLVDTGEVDAAFTTVGPDAGWNRPVVSAPVAFGGFAIAFNIDDEEHQRRTELRLNARLVAKLLSSSYPALPVVRDNHPSLGHNPLNITLDPEFWALNPGLPRTSNVEAAAALQIFSSSSDLLRALTSWIDADPEARAWLNGYADPWGMTVNDAYRGIDLPVDNWPLLDSWTAPAFYQDQNPCYGKAPTPMMQLIANPTPTLGTVVVNMQYASSAVQTACRFDGSDPGTLPLKQQGRQTVGYRFVLGLVSLSAAERYNLRTASLQTTTTTSPGKPFTDASGRTFVAPDEAGLTAAAALLRPDDASGVWRMDYAAISGADGAAAYPGGLPVYLAAPTQGLDDDVATRLARMLCYAAGPGQEPGAANGELPAGYLPLTEDDGFGAQRAYLATATAAVRRQEGEVPALDVTTDAEQACDFGAEPPEPTPTPSEEPSGTPTETVVVGVTVTPPPGTDPGTVDPGTVAPVDGPGAEVGGKPTAPPTGDAPAEEAAPVSLTAGESTDLGRLGVPLLLLVALLSGLAGSVLRFYDELGALLVATQRSVRSARSRTGRRG